jgi:hypothetical protein
LLRRFGQPVLKILSDFGQTIHTVFGNYFLNHKINYTSKELFGKAEKSRRVSNLDCRWTIDLVG